MLSTKENLISYLVGSSTIGGLISFVYIGYGFYNWRNGDGSTSNTAYNLPFEWMMGIVLILLGLFNVIAQNLIHESTDHWYGWNFIVGAMFGLMLSSIGRFGFDFPVLVFGFTRSDEWTVHLHAMLLYGIVVFGGIIGNVSKSLL